MTTQILLANALMRNHPENAAHLLERIQPVDAAALLSQIDSNYAARVLERMVPVHAEAALREMTHDYAASVLAQLSIDLAASFIRRLPEEWQQTVISLLEKTSGDGVARVLQFPSNTAGAFMDPCALVVPDDISAAEAHNQIHKFPEHVRYYIYVVNRTQHLVGVVTLRELMTASPTEKVSSIMKKEVARIRATAASEEIIANPHWKEYHSLPVIDDSGAFLGVFKYETLRRLEDLALRNRVNHGAMETATAMGELFWIGLSGMLGGVISGVASHTDRRPSADEESVK